MITNKFNSLMDRQTTEQSSLGLVLRAQAYSDKDLILTLLTENSGKLGVMARAARGGSKGFTTGVPDILDLGVFTLRRGRGTLPSIAHVQPKQTFKRLRTNLASFVCACCWVEALEHLTLEAHQDSHELFETAIAVLAKLDQSSEPRLACRILCEGLVMALHRTGFGSEHEGIPAGSRKLHHMIQRIEEISSREMKSWPSVLEIIQRLDQTAAIPGSD